MSQRRLFTFDFVVKRISRVKLPAKCPLFGVTFQLMDFPPVLLTRPEETGRLAQDSFNSSWKALPPELDCASGKEELYMKKIDFRRGKSCLFEMDCSTLIAGLRGRGLHIELVGQDHHRLPTLMSALGCGAAKLSDAAQAFEDCLANSVEGKVKVHAVDTGNQSVGVIHAKYRLSSSTTAISQPVGRESKATAISQPVGRESKATAISQPVGRESKATALEAGLKKGAVPIRVGKETIENKSTNVGGSLTVSSETSKATGQRSVSEQTREDPSPSWLHQSSVVEDTLAEQYVYLPNAVCTPPLYYLRQQTTTGTIPGTPAISSTDGATESCAVARDNEQDPATRHWSVLMDHDLCSHPLSLKRAKVPEASFDSGHFSTSPPPQLPLLSALFNELSVLKSLVTNGDCGELRAPRVAREESSKSLQTEVCTPPPDNKEPALPPTASPKALAHSRPQSPHPLPHHPHGAFVRECCRRKSPNAGKVPKNRSVMYSSDIAHKRHKWRGVPEHRLQGGKNSHGLRSNQKVSSEEVQKDLPLSHMAKSRQTKKLCVESDGEDGNAASKFNAATRTLEVYVPQASVTASPESVSPAGSLSDIATEVTALKVHKSAKPASGSRSPKSTLDSTSRVAGVAEVLSPTSESPSTSSESRRGRGESPQPIAAHSINITVTQPADIVEQSRDSSNHAPGLAKPSGMLTVPSLALLSQEAPANCDLLDTLPLGKPASLLNIASQTLDSYMSVDSADIAEGFVLQRSQRGLFLVSSQSSASTEGGAKETARVNQTEGASAGVMSLDSELGSFCVDYSDDFESVSESSA